MHGRFLALRRNAHQAPEIEIIVRTDGGDEGVGLGRDDARLLGLLARIDLNQDARPPARRHGGSSQGAGQPFPVKGLDHVEQVERLSGLVGLQRSDQAKFQAGQVAAPVGPATFGLLNPIFAEHPLAGAQRGLNRRVRLLLGNGGQRDIGGVAARGSRGLCDTAARGVEGRGDESIHDPVR